MSPDLLSEREAADGLQIDSSSLSNHQDKGLTKINQIPL